MRTDVSTGPTTEVRLVAPITGVLVPIEQVPDPVFAQKMIGEGISIDPLSDRLLAPCDGVIATLHPSHHAVRSARPRGSRCSSTSVWTPSRCAARASRRRSRWAITSPQATS